MIPYARENEGYKYLLTQIDVYSKFARAEPVKSKSAVDVAVAFEKMLKGSKPPHLLQSDFGKEFFNARFATLTKLRGIQHYHTFSETKASVVERFNRTLKSMMWREFTRRGSYKWIDLIPALLDKYNSSIHRALSARPKDVTGMKKVPQPTTARVTTKPKLKVGDKVRVSHVKGVFDKGYLQNWSDEVFTVDKVLKTTPVVMYALKDFVEGTVWGSFYEQELQKTRVPDLFLIEKVLKKKKKKVGGVSYLVKWRGYDETYNSWVDNLDALGG
jgi:hypothetical protein